jgi:MFS family permease
VTDVLRISKILHLSRKMNLAKLPFHYGWVVVVASTLVMFIITSLYLTFGVFLEPISQATGWSRGDVSGTIGIHWIVGALAVFGAGWFIDRFGVRRTLVVGSFLVAVSLVLAGFSKALWQLHLFYGILFGIARSSFLVPLHVTVGLWFRRRLGVAMGIVNLSLAMGPLLMSPVLRYLIDAVGWGNTFVLVGIASSALMAALSLLIPNQPGDVGLEPYGEVEGVSITKTRTDHKPPFYREDQLDFFRYAVKTQPFALLILIHFLGCASHSIPLTHVVAMATDVGITPLVAATVLSLMSGISMVSNFGSSVFTDKAGGKIALALVMIFQAGGILILLGARNLWVFYLFTLIFGLGFGGEMVVFPVINRQYYGTAPIGKIYSAQMVGAGLGMAGGSYVGGLLFDMTGTYTSAIWLAALLSGTGFIFALRLASPFAPDPDRDMGKLE